MWIKRDPNADITDKMLISRNKPEGGESTFDYFLSGGVTPTFCDQGHACRNSNTNITDSNWHYLALTKDGSSWKWYLDGRPDGTSSWAWINDIVTTDWSIGGRLITGSLTPFYGNIDEVAVWNRALTDSEVQTLWNGGSGMSLAQ